MEIHGRRWGRFVAAYLVSDEFHPNQLPVAEAFVVWTVPHTEDLSVLRALFHQCIGGLEVFADGFGEFEGHPPA